MNAPATTNDASVRIQRYHAVRAAMADLTDRQAIFERLVLRGLAPESWAHPGPDRPRWWCQKCAGVNERCDPCERFSRGARRNVQAALSLGLPALWRVDQLAADIGRALHWKSKSPTLLWSGRTGAELRTHHATVTAKLRANSFAPLLFEAFSYEVTLGRWADQERWKEGVSRGRIAAARTSVVYDAWPALRELAVTGVHVLDANYERLLLAVPTWRARSGKIPFQGEAPFRITE